MKVKMGNWSRDTMADKAITSPKSFPKCSAGKLGRETNRVPVSSRSPLSKEGPGRGGPVAATSPKSPSPRPGFTHPHPTPTQLFPPHLCSNTEHGGGIVRGPGETAGTQTQAVPTEVSRKRQTHEQVSICWVMGALSEEAGPECQGHKEGRHSF